MVGGVVGGGGFVLANTGPLGSVMERVPLVVVTRKGKSARFVAVIEPVRAGGKPAVESVALSEAGGALIVTVKRTGGEDILTVSPKGGASMVYGGRKIFPVE